MDDALIEAVYRREPLWNPDNELHKNAHVLKKLWEEVAYELKRDVKTIKSRWKNMRAYFFKEHKKISEKPSLADGSDNANTSWQYYEPLLFLKRSGNSEEDSNVSVEYEENDCAQEEIQTSPRKRQMTSLTDENDKLDRMRKKLKVLERESVKGINDDMLFFESLLPYMSNIPLVRKLRLRSKIQDLILAELEAEEYNK